MDEGEEAVQGGGGRSSELLQASRRILQRGRPFGEKDDRERGSHTIGHTMANQIIFNFFFLGKIPIWSPINGHEMPFYPLKKTGFSILSLFFFNSHFRKKKFKLSIILQI